MFKEPWFIFYLTLMFTSISMLMSSLVKSNGADPEKFSFWLKWLKPLNKIGISAWSGYPQNLILFILMLVSMILMGAPENILRDSALFPCVSWLIISMSFWLNANSPAESD